MPDPARTADIWRTEALRAGIGDIYMARVESFDSGLDPASIGFDADIEFAPNWRRLGAPVHRDALSRLLIRLGLLPEVYLKQTVATYEGMMRGLLAKPMPDHVRFRGVTPGFDNSSRRSEGAAILIDSSPDKYESWLRTIAEQTRQHRIGDERIVFINAWNEWAEGNHLEPDLKHGHAFLKATANVIGAQRPENHPQQHGGEKTA